jgi:hypothetical protein
MNALAREAYGACNDFLAGDGCKECRGKGARSEASGLAAPDNAPRDVEESDEPAPGEREVGAKLIAPLLASKGFVPVEDVDNRGRELVLARVHDKCEHTRVEVFTTLGDGDLEQLPTLDVRVVGRFSKKSEKFPKPFQRVFFKEALSRISATVPPEGKAIEELLAQAVYEVAREAYGAANNYLKSEAGKCFTCSARGAGGARDAGGGVR